ncbi:hypothetical protein [Alteromonas halophila]|uniref:Late embryogenesis abundant protein n=1 Tax=Alteromonas halophila TaxID=516698 RepID=A0A918JEG0_9ALTE|nr:hypothetical protein [Alteromonas halophila]GGW76386.1 hypothetical protein GCM10007391_06250 [Alteromonas halophila]
MRTTKIIPFLLCIGVAFSLTACSEADKEKAEEASKEMAEKTKGAMDDAKEAGEDMADDAEDAMSDAKEAGEKWADDAKETSEEWADDASDKADEMGDAMKEKGEAIKEKSKEMYEEGKQAIADKAKEYATFGACFEKAGCNEDDKTASSVTESQCDASGGKSWYDSDADECVNL